MVSDFQQFIVRLLLAAVCTILIGLVFFGQSVFIYSQPAFQFTTVGIFGGLMLATTKVTSVPKSIGVLALAAFFHEILFTPFGAPLIVRDILFLIGIGLTIILYRVYFVPQLNENRLSRVLVLTALMGINAIIVTALLSLVIPLAFEGNHVPSGALPTNLALQFLIGIGIGVGDELSNLTKTEWQRLIG